MLENESLPWTDVYRHALDDHSRFIQLSDGLLGAASVSTFSEGYTTIFDLSGYTKIVKDLDKWQQMKLSEAIVNGALEFGKKINAILVQPPAGDQGIYYSQEDPGELPIEEMVKQIEEDADLKRDSLSAKAVIVPHDRNSLFLGTFLSPRKRGEQSGYTALMGPAYTRGLSRLSRIAKDEVIRTEKPKPFNEGYFRELDMNKNRTSKKYVERAVNVLSAPKVPEGPYMHAVLKAWDIRGRANLVDPSISATLAKAFLENRKSWQPVKQDEGHLHIVSKEQPEDARVSLSHMLESIEREAGLPGTKIQFASTSVRNSVRLQVRDHVDFAGIQVIDLVHQLKGKNVEKTDERHL